MRTNDVSCRVSRFPRREALLHLLDRRIDSSLHLVDDLDDVGFDIRASIEERAQALKLRPALALYILRGAASM